MTATTETKNMAWTVVFLLDAQQPEKIVVLQRAHKKTFAPDYYTGIGGKVEPDEAPLDGAYRELAEETDLTGITLQEFARCHILDVGSLYYYWGIFPQSKLPDCNEGTLEWVSTDQLMQKRIIPTTRAVCAEWKQRNFDIQRPFTVKEISHMVDHQGVRIVEVVETQDGLA